VGTLFGRRTGPDGPPGRRPESTSWRLAAVLASAWASPSPFWGWRASRSSLPPSSSSASFQGAQRQLNQNIAESEEFIRQDERNNDAIQRFKDPAKQARMSVVGYLNDSLKQTMGAVSGSANDTFTQLSEKLQKVEGASSNNLIGVVHTRDAEIADLKTKLDDSDKSRQTALQDLRNEADRTKALEEAHKKTIDSMNADIDRYKAEVEQYRQQVNEAKQGMDVREASGPRPPRRPNRPEGVDPQAGQ
jgi:chromosome segregation ATPase